MFFFVFLFSFLLAFLFSSREWQRSGSLFGVENDSTRAVAYTSPALPTLTATTTLNAIMFGSAELGFYSIFQPIMFAVLSWSTCNDFSGVACIGGMNLFIGLLAFKAQEVPFLAGGWMNGFSHRLVCGWMGGWVVLVAGSGWGKVRKFGWMIGRLADEKVRL